MHDRHRTIHGQGKTYLCQGEWYTCMFYFKGQQSKQEQTFKVRFPFTSDLTLIDFFGIQFRFTKNCI